MSINPNFRCNQGYGGNQYGAGYGVYGSGSYYDPVYSNQPR